MVRHTLKILQHLLEDFYSVSDHFTTLRSKRLKRIKKLALVSFLNSLNSIWIIVAYILQFLNSEIVSSCTNTSLHMICCRNKGKNKSESFVNYFAKQSFRYAKAYSNTDGVFWERRLIYSPILNCSNFFTITLYVTILVLT